MLEVSKEKLAYIAGFFDGEGCVSVQHGCLTVSVSNTVMDSLILIQEVFGSKVAKYPCKGNRRPVYTWRIHAKNAESFLKQVLPYLIIKKRVAILGLELQATSFHSDEREFLANQICELNRRGTGPSTKDLFKQMDGSPK